MYNIIIYNLTLIGKMLMQQLRILKGMVAVFVFCQCFTIVADVYELICTIGMSGPERTRCPYNIHIENLINVAHFMLSINSSINFIFYMININGFKTSFIKVRNNCFQIILLFEIVYLSLKSIFELY